MQLLLPAAVIFVWTRLNPAEPVWTRLNPGQNVHRTKNASSRRTADEPVWGIFCVAFGMRQFWTNRSILKAAVLACVGKGALDFITWHHLQWKQWDLSLESNDSPLNARSNFWWMLVFFYTIIPWCLHSSGGAEKAKRSGWSSALSRESTPSSLINRHLFALPILLISSTRSIKPSPWKPHLQICFFVLHSFALFYSELQRKNITAGVIRKERPRLSTTFRRNSGKFYILKQKEWNKTSVIKDVQIPTSSFF